MSMMINFFPSENLLLRVKMIMKPESEERVVVQKMWYSGEWRALFRIVFPERRAINIAVEHSVHDFGVDFDGPA
jgi:hypothetical protein